MCCVVVVFFFSRRLHLKLAAPGIPVSRQTADKILHFVNACIANVIVGIIVLAMAIIYTETVRGIIVHVDN